MNRVLLGVRGEPTPEGMERILSALRRLPGVAEAQAVGPAQIQVEYDPQALTVMDLIRTVREQGFLAGML
ncbi:heavy-metal-associated domain-containing protein [Thermus sp.]|uniref:heavy-metal-associated domain-containing protein n=1 Tax=Thermus sp. TaxID=275 RepID=UPI00307D840B